MIVKENKNYVFLRKSGNFYHVFDDDAIIFNSLFGYRIINCKVGFPINSITKVINILEEKKINYIIDNENITKDFKNKNCYKKILNASLIQNNIKLLIDKMESKLLSLTYEQLIIVLDKMENVINDL